MRSVETPVRDLLEVMTAASAIEVVGPQDVSRSLIVGADRGARRRGCAAGVVTCVNLMAADAAGIGRGDGWRDVVTAIAPIVGTARTGVRHRGTSSTRST